MKKLLFIIMFVLLSFQLAFADRIPVPSGSIRWDNFRDNYFNVQTEELYNFLGALDGELPESPTFDSLIISGSGNSWLELGNNTSFTDVLTGKGGYGLLNWLPYAILNGTPTRLALYSELEAGDTSVIQDDDPTLASATGKYYSRASGDYFNVVHGIEMFAIAGTRTADTVAPVIVAGADSTHDGSTPVTATMVLTELYPDPSTLLYTVTGGTPASGTWTGTYPNYSLEVTPTGTDDIVVTSSGSDLAGNSATGTDLSQTFVYSNPSQYTTLFRDDFNRPNNTNVIVDGPPGWTWEIDAGGIASILNNAYSVAHNATNTCRISNTISSNNTDYEVQFKFKLSDVTDIDTSGTARSVSIDQVYTSDGLYLSIFIQCDTSGEPYRFGVTRVNDAGSFSVTYTNFTFVADEYINITIQSDIGAPATADGVCKITANNTTLLDLTNVADETRSITTENRIGIDTGDTLWNQALTITYDDFVMGYK